LGWGQHPEVAIVASMKREGSRPDAPTALRLDQKKKQGQVAGGSGPSYYFFKRSHLKAELKRIGNGWKIKQRHVREPKQERVWVCIRQ